MAVALDLAGPQGARDCRGRRCRLHQWNHLRCLNNIAEQTRRIMIIVLNDNEWSIDRNVGAIARYFRKIVTNEHYKNLYDSAHCIIERLGGKTAAEVARRAEEAAKSMLWPSILLRSSACSTSVPSMAIIFRCWWRTSSFSRRKTIRFAACADAKRPRLSTRTGSAKEVSRPRPIRSRKTARRSPQVSLPTPKSLPDSGSTRQSG